MDRNIKINPGPWVETHEFAGEIRRVLKGEDFLKLNANVPYVDTWHTSDRSCANYPILRKLKPKWQPPKHLIGTGWKLRYNTELNNICVDIGLTYDLRGWTVVDSRGKLTPIGIIMQLDPGNLPKLKPGEEIVL